MSMQSWIEFLDTEADACAIQVRHHSASSEAWEQERARRAFERLSVLRAIAMHLRAEQMRRKAVESDWS